MKTPARRLIDNLGGALAIATLVAAGAVFVPGRAAPVNAVSYCGIKVGYMCVYLSLSGNGSGNATFQSYAFNGGPTVTLSDAACVRQYGANSGTCLLTLTSSTASSVTVTAYLASLGGSCYRYNGGGCTGSGGPVSPSFSWVNGSVGINVEYDLLNPETLTVTRSGTGSGSVISSPHGINCPGTCSADFASGTSVQLTATADSGSIFGGYSSATFCAGTGHGSPTCTWAMNSPVDVTAIFNLPTPPPPTPSPTPKPTPSPTPKPTPTTPPAGTANPHPSATAAHGPTVKPSAGASGPAITAGASAPAAPSEPSATSAEASAAASEGGSETPGETGAGSSLAPLDTPPPELSNTSGPGTALVIIPIAIGLLGVGGFLLFRGLKRRA